MKDMFQRLLKKGAGPSAQPAASQLTLAAFGKHPGWDDHIPGIGVETDALAHVKQALYVGGIGKQVDSGAWEKLEPDKRLEGFDHVFLWLRAGHVMHGKLWSSTDRKGRAKYPMLLCVDGEGVTPAFVLARTWSELERLQEKCKATTSADQVTADCGAAQNRLRTLLGGPADKATEAAPPVEARRRFLERDELGPDRLGLLRVLHELGSALGISAGGRSSQTGALADLRPRHLRLPLASDLHSKALLHWSAFLRCGVPESVPILLISRSGVDWLDVIIGEPAGDDFFCLQASLKALPLATEIPYELAPELKTRLQELETKFLGVEPTPTVPQKKSTLISKIDSPPLMRNGTGVRETVAGRKGGKLGIFLGSGAMLLIVVAGLWLFRSGHGSAPEKSPVASNTGSVSAKVETAAAQQHAQKQKASAKANAKAGEEARLKAEAEEKRLAEEKAKADAEAKSREEARLKAEAEAKRMAEERRLADEKAQSEAVAKAREEARLKAEAEAKRVAEEKRLAEAKAKEERDYRSATNYSALGEYSEALKLCQAHGGIKSFDTLAKNLGDEQKALADAGQKFSVGDYSFIEPITQRYGGKKPFLELLKKATDEQRILGGLEAAERTNGWQYVKNRLAEPSSAGFASKRPFAERRKWAESLAAEDEKKQLLRLSDDYETLLVWFGLLKPKDAKMPKAQKEEPVEGIIDLKLKNQLLTNVDRLEKEFGNRGLLGQDDRGKNLKKLRNEIKSR